MAARLIAILDGPNSGLPGTRQPEIFAGRIIEGQVSGIHRREAFRHPSFVAAAVMAGFDPHGDRPALRHLASLLQETGPS